MSSCTHKHSKYFKVVSLFLTALQVVVLLLSYVVILLQVMVPYNFTDFIDDLTTQVKNKVIPMTRIDDAVRRILRVKFTMGLFENPMADLSFVDELGKQVSY